MDDQRIKPSTSDSQQAAVPSPCISVCQLDPVSNLCIGCLRSLEEIRDWPVMAAAEKRAVLTKLEQRKRAETS